MGKIPGRRAWQPTPVFLPGESPGTEEPGGLVCGVTKSWTQLKRLSTAHDYYVKGFNGINGQHVRTDGPCKLRGGNPKKGTIGSATTLV